MRVFYFLCLVLVSCGYSSRNNEVIGQVKGLVFATPLICPNRTDVDMSLGVMVNGAGSMSSEDFQLTVFDRSLVSKLKRANEKGSIVKVTFDSHRFCFCQWCSEVTGVENVK